MIPTVSANDEAKPRTISRGVAQRGSGATLRSCNNSTNAARRAALGFPVLSSFAVIGMDLGRQLETMKAVVEISCSADRAASTRLPRLHRAARRERRP